MHLLYKSRIKTLKQFGHHIVFANILRGQFPHSCPEKSVINGKHLIINLVHEFYRYTGRGLFLDPPTVYMRNSIWNLALPEGFRFKTSKLENIGKHICCYYLLSF